MNPIDYDPDPDRYRERQRAAIATFKDALTEPFERLLHAFDSMTFTFKALDSSQSVFPSSSDSTDSTPMNRHERRAAASPRARKARMRGAEGQRALERSRRGWSA